MPSLSPLSSLVSAYSFLGGSRGNGVGVYLSLSGSGRELGGVGWALMRLGAYSRWALIRGWALIRINTVNVRTSGHALVSSS